MKAILLSTLLLALVACSKRDDVPSQTTTTWAEIEVAKRDAGAMKIPSAEPSAPLECMNCDAGSRDEERKPSASPPRNAPLAPGQPLGTSLLPRSESASEAARDSTNGGAGSRLFGPSLVPAPAAPTSPASEVQGQGGGGGSRSGGAGGGGGGSRSGGAGGSGSGSGSAGGSGGSGGGGP